MKTKLIFGIFLGIICVFLLYDAISSINPYQSVSEIISHGNVGDEVRILGRIHDFRYTENGSLIFNLSDMDNDSAMIHVIYAGTQQQQVQAGQKAVVVGKLTSEKTILAEKLLMKCPSKYE